jgi:hypothetical protein
MWFLKASKVTKVVRMPNGFYAGRNLKKKRAKPISTRNKANEIEYRV